MPNQSSSARSLQPFSRVKSESSGRNLQPKARSVPGVSQIPPPKVSQRDVAFVCEPTEGEVVTGAVVTGTVVAQTCAGVGDETAATEKRVPTRTRGVSVTTDRKHMMVRARRRKQREQNKRRKRQTRNRGNSDLPSGSQSYIGSVEGDVLSSESSEGEAVVVQKESGMYTRGFARHIRRPSVQSGTHQPLRGSDGSSSDTGDEIAQPVGIAALPRFESESLNTDGRGGVESEASESTETSEDEAVVVRTEAVSFGRNGAGPQGTRSRRYSTQDTFAL